LPPPPPREEHETGLPAKKKRKAGAAEVASLLRRGLGGKRSVARPGGSMGRSAGLSIRTKPPEGDASLSGEEEPSRADPCGEDQIPRPGGTDQDLQVGEEEAPAGASDPPAGGPQTEGRPELSSLAENLLGADEAGARFRYHLSFARKVRTEVGTEAKKTPAKSYPEEWLLRDIIQLEGPQVEAITMGTLWARASDLERAGSPLPLKKLLSILTRPSFEVAESELSALTGEIARGLRGRAAVCGALPKRVDRTTQTPHNMLRGPHRLSCGVSPVCGRVSLFCLLRSPVRTGRRRGPPGLERRRDRTRAGAAVEKPRLTHRLRGPAPSPGGQDRGYDRDVRPGTTSFSPLSQPCARWPSHPIRGGRQGGNGSGWWGRGPRGKGRKG